MIFLLKHNDEKHKKLTSDAGTVVFFGWGGEGGRGEGGGECFSYVEISGNFGREMNGTLRSAYKFCGQSVPAPGWSSLTGRFGPTETCSSISKNCRFQSYFAGHNQNFGRKTNGCFVSIHFDNSTGL